MAENKSEKMKWAVMKAELDNYNDKNDSEEILKTISDFVKQFSSDMSDEGKVKYLTLMG